MTITTIDRPNRHPGACIRCHAQVPARVGRLAKRGDGSWAVDHVGDCPDTTGQTPEPVRRVDHDGIYRTPDGTIYKVQHAKLSTGRLYAKQLVLTRCRQPDCDHPTTIQPDGSHQHGHFEYAPGAIHTLTADMALTLEAARTFGRLYGICSRCGSDLTDETSIAAGLGPTCRSKF